MERVVSKIDTEGMLVLPVIEISDADLDTIFSENPGMETIVGVPQYWSEKHGYWPKPSAEWRTTP